MLTRLKCLSALAIVAGAAFASPALADDPAPNVFTQWNFNALPTGSIVNSPTPSLGQGTAVPLGMTNNYHFGLTNLLTQGSTTYCDVLAAGASSDTANSPNNSWRVRGAYVIGSTLTPGIGWALEAPEKTQGAEFRVSTVNYKNIVLSFDWANTGASVHDMQVEYSTDGGATWKKPVHTAGVGGAYYGTDGHVKGLASLFLNGITFDLSADTTANDNPNFRVRMTSIYDPAYVPALTTLVNPYWYNTSCSFTAPLTGCFAGAGGKVKTYSTVSGSVAPNYNSNGQYNNNSGNWRFDAVTFTGVAIRSVAPTITGSSQSSPAVCNTGGPMTFSVTGAPGVNPISNTLSVYADMTGLGLSAAQSQNILGATVSGTTFTAAAKIKVAYNGGAPSPQLTLVGLTPAQLKAAIEALPNWPVGAVATVTGSNATNTLMNMTVTFDGTLANTYPKPITIDASAAAFTPASGSISFIVSLNQTVFSDAAHGPIAFFDDGTNGDTEAGNGVFTYAATIPSGRPLAPVSFTATLLDDQNRTATTNFNVAVGDCSIPSTASVVISQTFGGGGNLGQLTSQDAPFDADYVEIYNRTGSPVSLNGWSVQYASQASVTGFDSTGDQVLLSGTIQPHQYMLIRMSDPTAGFNPLPTPDFAQILGFGGMGNTGGRVALVRSTNLIGNDFTTNVEDFVGYGGAISFEGIAPTVTPSPSSNTAMIRKSSGAQDSNQNFNDFAAGTPNPHNRASGNFLSGTPFSSATAACTNTDITLSLDVFPATTSSVVIADVSSIVGAPATVTLPFAGGSPHNNGASYYSATFHIPANAAQGTRTIGFTLSDLSFTYSDPSSLSVVIASCSNSAAPVVISRVYGGGGNSASGYTADFAEIFNRSDAPVSLNGWSFQSCRISDNGFDGRGFVPLSGTLNPGEYRLIVAKTPSTGGAAIMPPYFINNAAEFGMESNFGRVALVSSLNLIQQQYTRADVVDLVGYGSAAQTFEGVAPTGTLDDVHYAARKQGGCQDTNQNAIDFDVVLALELPHNANSTPAPCGVTLPVVCCSSGACSTSLTAAQCTSGGGTVQSAFSCAPVMCTPVTVTCCRGSTCAQLPAASCPPNGSIPGTGSSVASGATCTGTTFAGCCYADYNKSGAADIDDIFAYNNAWFSSSPYAKVGGDGVALPTIDDLFLFYNAWFSGCTP